MSYNGIGLSTVRGSGTNGFVQRNMSYVRPRNTQSFKAAPDFREGDDMDSFGASRKPNAEILEHQKKRQVELACLELRDELEAKAEREGKEVDEEAVELVVTALRTRLMADIEQKRVAEMKQLNLNETHAMGEAKQAENARLADAFGIRTDSYKSGSSFDPDYQERQKQERIAARNADYEKRRLEREERVKEREARDKRQKEYADRRERERRDERDYDRSRAEREVRGGKYDDRKVERVDVEHKHREKMDDVKDARSSRSRHRSPSSGSESGSTSLSESSSSRSPSPPPRSHRERSRDNDDKRSVRDDRRRSRSRDSRRRLPSRDIRRRSPSRDGRRRSPSRDDRRERSSRDDRRRRSSSRDDRLARSSRDDRRRSPSRDDRRERSSRDDRRRSPSRDDRRDFPVRDERRPPRSRDEQPTRPAREERRRSQSRDTHRSVSTRDELPRAVAPPSQGRVRDIPRPRADVAPLTRDEPLRPRGGDDHAVQAKRALSRSPSPSPAEKDAEVIPRRRRRYDSDDE